MLKQLNKEQIWILWVLALINFFNYIDRQVIFPLFHNLQMEFHVSDTSLGLLGTVFMLVHSLASVPLGIAADKYSRKALITAGVAFWSVASFASGLAASFKALLGVRSMVGIGEASYAPAATAMLSDNFPQEFRAQAQSFFNAAMFIGGTLGAMIGGIIAYHYNWRYAFFIVSIPGLILAFLASRLKERAVPKRRADEDFAFAKLFNNPALIWVMISGTFTTFAAGGFISWGIEFVRRFKGYNLEQASLILGATMMVAGVLGVFIGSIVADHLQKKFAHGRALTVALSLVAAAPIMYLGVSSRHTGLLFLIYFFLGTLLMSFYHAPATAVIHDIVPKHMRATAFAFYVLVIHLLGDTPAPAVLGRISDIYNLRVGLQIMTGFVLLSGLCFLYVSRIIKQGRVKIYLDE